MKKDDMKEIDVNHPVFLRAKEGQFREYWLQLYFKGHFEKYGFKDVAGPFNVGPDFFGMYKGKRVAIEIETESRNFIYHKHDVKCYDILVVLKDNTDIDVKGMNPKEWRKKIPKKIIVVDHVDFIMKTHPARKEYAIKKQKEYKVLMKIMPFIWIKRSISKMYQELLDDIPLEDTPESAMFEIALIKITFDYIEAYDIDINKMSEKPIFTRFEVYANDLLKSRRSFEDFDKDEKEHIFFWLNLLRYEYGILL